MPEYMLRMDKEPGFNNGKHSGRIVRKLKEMGFTVDKVFKNKEAVVIFAGIDKELTADDGSISALNFVMRVEAPVKGVIVHPVLDR